MYVLFFHNISFFSVLKDLINKFSLIFKNNSIILHPILYILYKDEKNNNYFHADGSIDSCRGASASVEPRQLSRYGSAQQQTDQCLEAQERRGV